MYCHPEEVMEQEKGFLAALGRAVSYRIQGEGLEIANSDGAMVLVFGVADPTPLTGTTWQALHYYDGLDRAHHAGTSPGGGLDWCGDAEPA